MSTAKMVFHGSDIEKICEVYQLKSEEIVKFGANVNPLGLSEHVKEQLAGRLDILSSYPDRDYTSLRSTISEYCNIPAEFILPGNGSSELIALLIQERNPKHTLILGPTYSEYSRELSFSGSTQEYYHLREEDNFVLDVDDFCRTLDGKYDFLILCNPNNPTSSAISINDLRRIVSFCNERNIFVMIDETYVEFAPDINEITAVSLTREFTNLMILRGVSKFYAAPGMRLGYGITGNLEFLKKMKEKQVPWSLNSLGALAGELMLQDKTYIRQTRDLILSERTRLLKALENISTYKTYPAYANFLLLKIQKPGLTSRDVFDACIRQGLMIRDCSSFECLDGEWHNGRSGKHGVYNPRHNDRQFDVSNSEHIDAEREKQNIYWDCYRGYVQNPSNEILSNLGAIEPDVSFHDIEKMYYIVRNNPLNGARIFEGQTLLREINRLIFQTAGLCKHNLKYLCKHKGIITSSMMVKISKLQVFSNKIQLMLFNLWKH